jgi:hypothetical protein
MPLKLYWGSSTKSWYLKLPSTGFVTVFVRGQLQPSVVMTLVFSRTTSKPRRRLRDAPDDESKVNRWMVERLRPVMFILLAEQPPSVIRDSRTLKSLLVLRYYIKGPIS